MTGTYIEWSMVVLFVSATKSITWRFGGRRLLARHLQRFAATFRPRRPCPHCGLEDCVAD